MNKQSTPSFPVVVGALVIAVAVFSAMVLLQGFVFSRLWAWYLVPLGLPMIGYAHAFMIVLMGRLIGFKPNLQEEKGEAFKRTGQIACAWLFALGVGYMLSSYVV